MRVVGFVPSKLNSKRLPRKNVMPLGGIPLVNYTLRTLADVGSIDDVVVFASDDEVMQHVTPGIRCRFVQRPEWLDGDDASAQDFITAFLAAVDAEIVVLLHITSPFIASETVAECIDAVASGRHDSAFAALEAQRFAWFQGAPLNYSLDRPVPRTQDLEPVVLEQSGLYVFRRDGYERTQRRIGERPYIRVVDAFEGHDIDTDDEFKLAELLVELKTKPR